MRKRVIAPSILSADFKNLKEDILKVEKAGADWIHCDVMDGVFVPNISFGPMIVAEVDKITDLPLDVHLMITEPIRYIEQFAKAGADIIAVHANACEDLETTIQKIKECKCKVGVAVNPDISIDLFMPYLDQIDLVLIMSVYAGFGGQSFLPETMEKVSAVAKEAESRGINIDIEVDGGINDETAQICYEAGANVVVAGSYVFKGDYTEKIASLR